MTATPDTHPGPDAFLTPKFYNDARLAGGLAITHDPESIVGLGDFIEDETGHGLPAPVGRLDFAYYLDVGGHRPWRWDTHYAGADPGFRYMHGGQIGPLRVEPNAENSTTKADIAARHTTVLEIQTRDVSQPLGAALARALIIPAYNDERARFIATPAAWVRQIGGVLNNEVQQDDGLGATGEHFTDVDNPRLQAEAARRFPNAVQLRKS